jgi:hypothetical protein
MALALFADSVITVPAPKTEHQGESLGNPLPAAGHARFGPSQLVGAGKRNSMAGRSSISKAHPWASPQAGLSVLRDSKRELESWLLNLFPLWCSQYCRSWLNCRSQILIGCLSRSGMARAICFLEDGNGRFVSTILQRVTIPSAQL